MQTSYSVLENKLNSQSGIIY